MCRVECTYVLYNFRNLMVQSEHMQVKSAQPEGLKYLHTVNNSTKGKTPIGLEGGRLRVSHASTSSHPRQRLSAPHPIWNVACCPQSLGGWFLDGVHLDRYLFCAVL